MICVKDENQIALFETPFENTLDKNNCWIKFSKIIPWDKVSSYYNQRMCNKNGAVTTDARIVLGALIIKHHENLSDVGTIEAIEENIYMQYFLGLPSFKTEPVFAPSLFVEIRKRLGLDYWNEINAIIIKHNAPKIEDDDGPTDVPSNKGSINIDATIVEQDIQYPTDLGILNESRERLEELVDVICNKTGQAKPRLYRITARKQYLNVAKKKKRTHKVIRKAVGRQLNYVSRNLKQLECLLTDYPTTDWIFTKHELKYLQVITEVYRGQKQMHSTKTHSIADRIVSIHQPHVRPMVRGKAGANVEFGSKIGVCIHNGLTHLDHLSWDSYNETEDLKTSANNYKNRNGYFPAKINADQIYITRENRAWCKEKNIQLNGKPLGRPTEQTKERIKELRQAVSERNCVEGKFGQAKRWYGMGCIHAKLKATSESMIGAIVVVLNLVRLVQQHVYTFFKIIADKMIDALLTMFYPKFNVGLFEYPSYHYYLPSEHSDLSLITAVHLNNDSTTKKKTTMLRIQFLMAKLNSQEILISENKEIFILDTVIRGVFTTKKIYWAYSESGSFTDAFKSRLKIKNCEKLNNPKYLYFESTCSVAD